MKSILCGHVLIKQLSCGIKNRLSLLWTKEERRCERKKDKFFSQDTTVQNELMNEHSFFLLQHTIYSKIIIINIIIAIISIKLYTIYKIFFWKEIIIMLCFVFCFETQELLLVVVVVVPNLKWSIIASTQLTWESWEAQIRRTNL